jgi:hypothetical protein
MLRSRNAILLLALTFAGCTVTAGAKEPLAPATHPRDEILSDDDLRRDDANHLPTDNETGQVELVGDLLQNLVKVGSKDPELRWFQLLLPIEQREVIEELNHYTFVFNEKLLVKSRVRDNYDMYWRFADPAPTKCLVELPRQSTGKTKSLQVNCSDVLTFKNARNTNDERSVNAQFVWQPAPAGAWAVGRRISLDRVTFTLPMHYAADCKIINRVPRRVDSLDGIYTLSLLPDGSVQMTIYPDNNVKRHVLDVRLALNGTGSYKTVVAKPGDSVAIYLVDALGSGAAAYTYLGSKDGELRFESFNWFYEIVPTTQAILEVAPYNRPPERTTPATIPAN